LAETSDLNLKYLRQSDKPAFAGSCQIQAGFITQRSEKPMATQQAKSIGKTDYAPPPIEGDFCRIEGL
jgi:hypothetical protein